MKVIKILIAVMIAATVASCGSKNRKERIVSMLDEWIGKELIIPDGLTFTVQSDTIDYNIADCDYKIVTFIDSASCTKCSLRALEWSQQMDVYNNLCNKDVNLVMILSPKDINEAEYVFKRDCFTYPYVIDKERKFFNSNTLPKNKAYHTFLIDGDNRVLAIGDPVYNPNIRRLFADIIAETDEPLADLPPLEASPSSRSVGLMKHDEKKVVKFSIRNTSGDDLTISETIASCRCSDAKVDRSVISAGSEAIFRLLLTDLN